MATASMPASTARNLDWYLQCMSGYSKNTIKIQPSSKFDYFAGDTVVFRLPTDSIIDLHTLTLNFSSRLFNKKTVAAGAADAVVQAATANASFPQHTSGFIRRNDWTMGGLQAGLGSVHDYGFLYNLLAQHKIPNTRSTFDLGVTDQGRAVNVSTSTDAIAAGAEVANGGPHLGASDGSYRLPPGGTLGAPTVLDGVSNPSNWSPKSISSWLGLPGGQFMRFLDINILPDIEIRLLLAPNSVVSTDQVGQVIYQLQNLSISCESISFGDGSYRAMDDSRMASGEPLLITFYNWAGFEGTSTMQNVSQQFTMAAESLNAILGTLWPGNYDAQTLPQIGSINIVGAGTGTSRYIPSVGNNPAATVAEPNVGTAIETQESSHYNWYHAALSGERCQNDQYGPVGQWAANYQFNIDSKLYPQFFGRCT